MDNYIPKQLKEADMESADIILCMSIAERNLIRREYPRASGKYWECTGELNRLSAKVLYNLKWFNVKE